MISKDIIILTKNDLYKLCQDIFYMGESRQYNYFDTNLLNNCLKEIGKVE